MLAYQTPADAPKWKRRVLYSPLARIVIFTLMVVMLVALTSWIMRLSGYSAKHLAPATADVVRYAVLVSASVLAYLVLVRRIENRRPVEFGLRHAPAGLAAGAVGGAALMTLVVGLLWAAGSYRITGTNSQAAWVATLLTGGIGAAVFEEIVFRGVIYRITEEGLGTVPALVLSSIFFGAVHLFNPGSTAWGAIAISIEAGLLFGMLYNVTRSLWPCIGLHLAWNFTQGTVWGVPVSGFAVDSFIRSERSGPEWLSGGSWGAEGSVVTVAVCLLMSLTLAGAAIRRRTLVKRFGRTAPIIEAATTQATSQAPSC